MGAVDDPRPVREQLERLRLRCWELEVALDWYLARIHQLEAYVGAEPRRAGNIPDGRPSIVASGDDAADRHFARLQLYETELRAAEAEKLELSREIDYQAREAAKRLAMLEQVAIERDIQAKVAEERLVAIDRLGREHAEAVEKAAARLTERDATIEQLMHERDVQAEAARERLAAINDLARERDIQGAAATERLVTIERLQAALREREGDAALDEPPSLPTE